MLEGESRFLPNLHFDLGDVQLREMAIALQKLEGAHRTRVAWVGPYSLQKNHLSIHALDFLSVLCQCRRTPENELEIFRLRRSAIEQINSMKTAARNDIKIQNLEMWEEYYSELWPGAEANRDLGQPSPQPSRIDLIP